MFKQAINTTYDLKDATLEIIIMLLVSFILGYLFRYLLSKKPGTKDESDEVINLSSKLEKMQKDLEIANFEKADLKKTLTLEFSTQIDELKAKLSSNRADLEQCLASKAALKPLSKEIDENLADRGNINDLKIIEGIGPALSKVLNQAGINTFRELADTSEETLRQILSREGSRFKVHDPSTWPEQARLAAEGSWEELKKFQDKINFGLIS